jgi:hypothetical protein
VVAAKAILFSGLSRGIYEFRPASPAHRRCSPMTGLTQIDTAALIGTVRRWMEGVHTPPAAFDLRVNECTP